MFCPKCNKDFTGNFCPDCGFAAASTPDITKPVKSRKKSGCLIFLLAVVGVFILIVLVGSFSSVEPSSSVSVSASTPSEKTVPEAPPSKSASETKTIAHEQELTSGHFTAGIDFPAGKYNIAAISGGGNVSSDNAFDGGINAMMGDEESNKVLGNSLYEQEYKNVKLPEGTVLSVSSVIIKISSDAADAEPLSPRTQTITETVELTSGNYVSGEDFSEGVYDITAISGSGNVSSDNIFDGGINTMMGVAEANQHFSSLYDLSYLNVSLPTGTELTVNGLKISMTPSK